MRGRQRRHRCWQSIQTCAAVGCPLDEGVRARLGAEPNGHNRTEHGLLAFVFQVRLPSASAAILSWYCLRPLAAAPVAREPEYSNLWPETFFREALARQVRQRWRRERSWRRNQPATRLCASAQGQRGLCDACRSYLLLPPLKRWNSATKSVLEAPNLHSLPTENASSIAGVSAL